MFPVPLWCIQVFLFFPPPLQALNCRKSPHEMAREWKSNEATSCRWEMGWEEGTTFIMRLSEMPVSHRWNCCQLPQMPFLLTRPLSGQERPFQSQTPFKPPLLNSLWKHTCVVRSKQNETASETHDRLTGTTPPGMMRNSRTLSLAFRHIANARLQTEYFGGTGVLLLSHSRFSLRRPFIYILLIIQQGRGG